MTEINVLYLKKIQGKIFKIFPLFVEKNEGVTTYISSTIYELEGSINSMNEKQAVIMKTVLSLLEHFYDDSLAPNPDLNIIRREWLNAVNLIDKIIELEEEQ